MHPQDTIPEEWRPVVGWENWYSVSSHGRVRRERPGPGTHIGRILGLRLNRRGYWTAYLSSPHRGQLITVHRLVGAAFLGPLPPGLQTNHISGIKTDNRPENLEYITGLENMQHAALLGLRPTGDAHPSRRLPERLQRGDAHYSRREPWRLARGDRNGARVHPESRPRGDQNPSRLHPERLARGERSHKSTLTEADVREIRRLYAAGQWSQTRLGARYGVTQAAIGYIVRHDVWTHIE